jgi:hypothetical protein
MKATGLKALALAMVGIAGFAVAGSAFAQSCPTVSSNTGNSTPGGGGAWSSQSVGGGGFLNITTPGLAGTNCMLSVNVGTTPLSNARGFVSDTSPQNEPRYRARFYFDISALTLTLANYQTEVFNAFATTAPGTFNTDELGVYLIGGASPALRFLVADAGQASGFKTITQALPASVTGHTGHYYVEFDLTKGSGSSTQVACNGGDAGCFRVWVAPEGGTAPADASPTLTYSANNGGWSGVVQANLGLYSTTSNFRTHNNSATANLGVDEFDSRRQTFIGF